MITHAQLMTIIDSEIDSLGAGHCCKEIVSLIIASKSQNPVFSHTDFVKSCSKGKDTQQALSEIQRCINLLKSSRVGLLRQEYRYIDDEDVIYEVSTEDLQAAHMDGALNLEARGYPDADYLSKVYIVFAADKTVIQQ